MEKISFESGVECSAARSQRTEARSTLFLAAKWITCTAQTSFEIL